MVRRYCGLQSTRKHGIYQRKNYLTAQKEKKILINNPMVLGDTSGQTQRREKVQLFPSFLYFFLLSLSLHYLLIFILISVARKAVANDCSYSERKLSFNFNVMWCVCVCVCTRMYVCVFAELQTKDLLRLAVYLQYNEGIGMEQWTLYICHAEEKIFRKKQTNTSSVCL